LPLPVSRVAGPSWQFRSRLLEVLRQWSFRYRFQRRLSAQWACSWKPSFQFVFDMRLDYLAEGFLCDEAQRQRPLRREVIGPVIDNFADPLIGFTADQAHGLFTRHLAQGLDLVGDRC